ncbi:RNA polymerase I-specific transcription initiation factor RRN3 [Monomorium pharaonis]|uniref:RNA polymerase I-specific transcription initiation factor RRN3 n=1 Tax=Monomorium pharaonis TaxID=307658 RepID=UPI001746A7B5|nr:RNA polymerase I-specific transcription initiation factor RRN3 [Monomorium pharaonis]
MKTVPTNMSIVSSTVSSVSSILKTSGVREQFIKQPGKIYFKLPKDVKNILCNFTNGDGIKEYEKLIYSLKEGAVKDNDLAEFLTEARQCISLLDLRHESFVQVLLQIEWTTRSSEVISTYKLFLQDLVCMQTLHINIVLNRLVELFKPAEDVNTEREVGQFKDEDIKRLNHIHDILHKILEVVPMSNKVLLQSLVSQFPYIIHGTYIHEVYIYALLQILNYAPQLRSNILVFIINRLMMLDVNIPREETSSDKEDDVMDDCSYNEIADNDNLTKTNINTDKRKTVHPTARTLDSCIELFLKYMHNCCFVNDILQIENLRTLYFDILCAFEAAILPTHASQYVQYIMFYICSFRPVIVDTFTNWLWHKVIDVNVAPVLRQTAVCYISSLHATASFVSPGFVKLTMSNLTQWIHKYIISQENSEYINDDGKPHAVFYSVCQAFFHLFVASYKYFVESKNGILFLQNLDISKIVTCKLNPLKMCDIKIVRDFADITSMYQLAYCYAIIENNERNQLPIFGMQTPLPVVVPNFFPFESYTLEHSGRRITPLFRNNVTNIDKLV